MDDLLSTEQASDERAARTWEEKVEACGKWKASSIIKENDIIYIEVSDTGMGIPADKFDYIFEPYTKLAASNQFGQTFKGPGCGLYLVEVRANILGASIKVKSELGKGSTFTLSIPVHPKK